MATRIAVKLLLLCLLGTAAAGEKTPGWRLSQESSPYLQMHADNPVNWYPWGEAAFEAARRENRPLFISIGYFTCHWCHVMARESFSDPEIAAYLNAYFIPVKIDREQRPDIDAAYMRYLTLTRGQGGWPMSVWATPGGEPFLGGTYYPPERRLGRPGFLEVLETLAEVWKGDEKGVRESAALAVEKIRALGAPVKPLETIDTRLLERARRAWADSYDELQGGFGPAPKFPEPARLLFLLQDGDRDSIGMASYTLDRMVAGGIHDQLGGGFHRYAVDFDWHVPHFEKMLYDQALIGRACLAAWRTTRETRYADVAKRLLDFTLRELRHDGGGFFSALSADSPRPGAADGEAVEGAFYTWSWRQLADALGEGELREQAVARYGVTQAGEGAGELAGSNVLYQSLDDRELSDRLGLDLITVRQRNADIDRRLLAARALRPPVPVDDKVISAWNGHMITTLALAGRQLDEPRYIEAAAQAAAFVMENLYDSKTRTLHRDWREGERGGAGFSEDYASMAGALVALYRVTGERDYLSQAGQLADRLLATFEDRDNGGFYRTGADTELWLREKAVVDGAIISGNGVAIEALAGLGRLTGNKRYSEAARRAVLWASAQLQDAPQAMPSVLLAMPGLAGD